MINTDLAERDVFMMEDVAANMRKFTGLVCLP